MHFCVMPYDEQWHKSYLEKIAVIIIYFIVNPIYNGALSAGINFTHFAVYVYFALSNLYG